MEKKISQKALRDSWKIWFFWHGSSQQGENLLGNAVAHAMSPVIEELYSDDKAKKIDAYKRSLTLFNTEQQLGAIAPGILCGLEEACASDQCPTEVSTSVKVALIGPTSAIGDSLWVATLIPLLITLCMSITQLASSVSWLGPVIYMIGYPLLTAFVSWNMWKLGYRTGIEGIHKFMSGGKLENITSALGVLGLLVVGALTASFVSVNIPVSIIPVGGETAAIDLNTLINNIFPSILPLLLTLWIYRLYSKKKKSPLSIMGIILVLALVLTGLGYLTGVYA
ncbi:MAG: PTS system mannose/fructose/sorbose family transporter subunit IID [Angelakisella sp.]